MIKVPGAIKSGKSPGVQEKAVLRYLICYNSDGVAMMACGVLRGADAYSYGMCLP